VKIKVRRKINSRSSARKVIKYCHTYWLLDSVFTALEGKFFSRAYCKATADRTSGEYFILAVGGL
jgi:hypothetical protein